MITTKDINLKRDEPKKLKQKTTKDVEVKNLGYGEPLKAGTGPMITTHNIEEFQKKTEIKKRVTKARKAKRKKK